MPQVIPQTPEGDVKQESELFEPRNAFEAGRAVVSAMIRAEDGRNLDGIGGYDRCCDISKAIRTRENTPLGRFALSVFDNKVDVLKETGIPVATVTL